MRRLLALLLLTGCVAAPAPTPEDAPVSVEWGDAGAPIRPGVRIGDEAPAGVATGRAGGCTGAFLFSDANGTAYMSTAAHCFTTDEVNVAGVARATVAYCSFATDGPCSTDPTSGDPNDFGLLRLDPDAAALAHPGILGFEGPTDLAYCDDVKPGARVLAYGNSSFKPDAEPLKMLRGEVVSRVDAFNLGVRFDPPAVPADSGSPVLTEDGRALAVIRALQFDGTNHVVCLDAALDAMTAATGLAVELAKP